MRIHIGGDHAAYELHQSLATHLRDAGHEVVDHGPFAYDAQDDYPVFVLRAAEAVAADEGSLASCSVARATASRSPPTRSPASARRSPTAPSSRASRASTTTPRSSPSAPVSRPTTWRSRSSTPSSPPNSAMRSATVGGWVWFRRTRRRGTCRLCRPRSSAEGSASGPVPTGPAREARGHEREHRLSATALRCRTDPPPPTVGSLAQPCTVGRRHVLPAAHRHRHCRNLRLARQGALGRLRVH